MSTQLLRSPVLESRHSAPCQVPVEVLTAEGPVIESLVERWGMANYNIYSVQDITSNTLYVVGGLDTTEELINELLADGSDLTRFKNDRFCKPVSCNQRTGYGVGVPNAVGWSRIVIIPGTGDFHFLVKNHRGMESNINGSDH